MFCNDIYDWKLYSSQQNVKKKSRNTKDWLDYMDNPYHIFDWMDTTDTIYRSNY